jgi:RNA recognition motif-containing protein
MNSHHVIVERTVAQTKKPTGLSPTDPNNTTVFIGGVDATITQDALYSYFSPFGDIQAVKIPQGRGCAFVEFTTHESAERVLESLKDSCVIGSCHVRLAWGRPAPKPPPLPVVLSSLGVSPPSASQTTTATSTTTTATTTPPPMITTATAQHAATAVK